MVLVILLAGSLLGSLIVTTDVYQECKKVNFEGSVCKEYATKKDLANSKK